MFDLLTAQRASAVLGYLHFDAPQVSAEKMIRDLRVNLPECLDTPEKLNHPRKVFERKIRYGHCRPLPEHDGCIVAPADARVLVGSFRQSPRLFVKEKFFEYEQLLGTDKISWQRAFHNGSFAVFRLTPEKYHYTHTPVSGRVTDFYAISGAYHSCNPAAVVEMVTQAA